MILLRQRLILNYIVYYIRLAIHSCEQCIGFLIVFKFFGLAIKLQLTFGAVRYIREQWEDS